VKEVAPLAQWAAVRIHWLLMIEPPQNDWPEEVVKMTAACQGNCPFDAGEPLMILPLVALKGVIFSSRGKAHICVTHNKKKAELPMLNKQWVAKYQMT
jgi:hypothetical protein